MERISRLPGLKIAGLFTHLALRGRESDDGQMAAFLGVARALGEKQVHFGMLHALDSIGMLLIRNIAWTRFAPARGSTVPPTGISRNRRSVRWRCGCGRGLPSFGG